VLSWLLDDGLGTSQSRHLVGTFFFSRLSLRLFRFRHPRALVRYWQLKHSGLLPLVKQSQKNNLAVREFQGVVVRPGDALIDLAEDRRLVLDSAAVPGPQTYPFNFLCEGQLCAGQ
jgi:hypothetical protein